MHRRSCSLSSILWLALLWLFGFHAGRTEGLETTLSWDCLANQLLAEDYHGGEFDIRDTLWCKGRIERRAGIPAPCMLRDAFIEVESSDNVSIEPSEPLAPKRETVLARNPFAPAVLDIQKRLWQGL